MGYALLALSVLFNVVSYIIYKSISGLMPRLWWPLFVLGLAFGSVNTFLFARALASIRLSIAYPVFSAACIGLIVAASLLAFHEELEARQLRRPRRHRRRHSPRYRGLGSGKNIAPRRAASFEARPAH